MYQRQQASTKDPLVAMFGGQDARKVRLWMEQARAWVFKGGYPQIKVGEDEAGQWWEVPITGGDVQWCLASTSKKSEMGGAWGVCDKRAGWGTNHDGAGPCKRHEMLVDDKKAGGDGAVIMKELKAELTKFKAAY